MLEEEYQSDEGSGEISLDTGEVSSDAGENSSDAENEHEQKNIHDQEGKNDDVR